MAELLPTGTVTLLLADVEGSTQLWETQPDDDDGRGGASESRRVEAHCRARRGPAGRAGRRRQFRGRIRTRQRRCGMRAGSAASTTWRRSSCASAFTPATCSCATKETTRATRSTRQRGCAIWRTAAKPCMSSATEEMVEDRLPDDAWLTDLGRHPLRDLPRPMRVAQLCHPDVRNDFPPLRTSNTAAAHHLPAQLTTFVGRHAQMADIRTLLGDNRLRHADRRRRRRQDPPGDRGRRPDDGRFRRWCLVCRPSPDHPSRRGAARRRPRAAACPTNPAAPSRETLLRFVRDRHMLLVLDNCEHLLEASAALVNDILAHLRKGDDPRDESRTPYGQRRSELAGAVAVA